MQTFFYIFILLRFFCNKNLPVISHDIMVEVQLPDIENNNIPQAA